MKSVVGDKRNDNRIVSESINHANHSRKLKISGEIFLPLSSTAKILRKGSNIFSAIPEIIRESRCRPFVRSAPIRKRASFPTPFYIYK